jgi:hypothetical protein
MYIIFITFFVLIEMNVFFIANKPFCEKQWEQFMVIFIYLTYCLLMQRI